MSSSHQFAALRSHREAGEKFAGRSQWAKAEQEFQAACRLAPSDGMLWLQLARVQWYGGRGEVAAQSAKRSVELQPDNPLGHRMLDGMLKQLGLHQQAVQVFEQLAPAHQSEELLVMRASSLIALDRAQDAVAVCLQALGKNPRNALAHYHLGRALKALKMDEQSAISFETAALTDPEGKAGVRVLALPMVVLQLAACADWSKLEQYWQELLALIERGDPAQVAMLAPFTLLSMPSSPEQQLKVARLYTAARAQNLGNSSPGAAGPAAGRRLKLGWLSNDFYRHATVVLVSELLELLDRDRFEIFIYCHSIEDHSEARQRIRRAADHFKEVGSLGDLEVAQLMRDDGIDIAIDLKGHTEGSRLQLLAARPAPVQLTYLGYPGTTGADFIDYVIGDPFVTPLGHAAHFSERIAQMPHSYQPNDSKRELPAAHRREEYGLPQDAVVLCCFNQPYKITASLVGLWARMLAGAPNTVLWLLNWNATASRHLAQRLQSLGIDPQRLFFSPLVSPTENLARLRCADIFLDTWPYNAHTTASEALWAGVPVVTVPGQTFASRVAAGLLAACELQSFICADEEAYVQRVIALARHPEELRAAQRHLSAHRSELPLFDSRRYARDFEALLERMWSRQAAGLPPVQLPAQSYAEAEAVA